MCSSAKYIFVYDINTAYFLIYDWVFKVTKVYWRFLLMNPLFHHASSAILLPWILANNEGGAHVLIQVLQWEKETRVKELNIFNPSRELPSKRMLTLNQIIWYVLEVTCGWAVHFALLCCNYILLSAGKVSQLSTSLEQKSACCHFFFSTKMSLSAQLPAWFLDVFCFIRFLASSGDKLQLFPLSFVQNGKVWSVLNFHGASKDTSKSKWGVNIFL